MGKRSRFLRQAGQQEKGPAAGSGPPLRYEKARRILWAVAGVVTTLLNIILLCVLLAIYGLPAKPGGKNNDIADPRSQEVEELIRRYFRTWSNQDLKGYGACFLPDASVQFIRADGEIQQYSLAQFLESQADVFQKGHHETEAPESIDIHFEAESAQVVVYWKLTDGSGESFGFDHYTLLKRDGKWGIAKLLWFVTKSSR